MALRYDLNPRILSILRFFDLSSPYSLILERHKNVTNARECLRFVHHQIHGVFIALRKYSKLNYEDPDNPIGDVIFDLIEAYHGITDKSDYLLQKMQIHIDKHIHYKLFSFPTNLGWIETVSVIIIYLLFMFNAPALVITIFLSILLFLI